MRLRACFETVEGTDLALNPSQYGLGFGISGLELRDWGLGFGDRGLGFGVKAPTTLNL